MNIDIEMEKDDSGISLNVPKRQQLTRSLSTASGLNGFKTKISQTRWST